MKNLYHLAVILGALFVLVGVPVYASGYVQRKLKGTDAVSSPTQILEQPSGAYVVMMNPLLHTNKEHLEVWHSFFRGEEIDFLFEDISCVVADTDAAGLELAKSFQSRLPENQMKVRTEDVTLLLSKLEYGRYDVALLSKELYDVYRDSLTKHGKQAVVIEEDGI